MSEEPLAGYTVGVTAARRREELGALLERRGAQVIHAPAIRLLPLTDDTVLLAATRRVLADPVDVVVVTTAVGFRSWLEAADGWGVRDDLLRRLTEARLITRGPKARGAVRAAGLTDAWSPATESTAEVLRHLREEDLTGRRIAVQLYGEPAPELTGGLRSAGATVEEIPVYRWAPAEDREPLRRLVGRAVAGTVDAITFTSAPAVAATLAAAAGDGIEEPLLDALRGPVVAACVGPVTAAGLERRDVPAVQPDRARIGPLVRALAAALPSRRARRVVADGHTLELRGHAVVVDGRLRPIEPAPMAVLRTLAERPGHPVSRAELRDVLPGEATSPPPGEHAVDTAVARLRDGLGHADLVRTVAGRGYRLAADTGRPGPPPRH